MEFVLAVRHAQRLERLGRLAEVLLVSQPTFAYQHLWRTSVQLAGWLLAICVAAVVLVVLHFILKPLRDREDGDGCAGQTLWADYPETPGA